MATHRTHLPELTIICRKEAPTQFIPASPPSLILVPWLRLLLVFMSYPWTGKGLMDDGTNHVLPLLHMYLTIPTHYHHLHALLHTYNTTHTLVTHSYLTLHTLYIFPSRSDHCGVHTPATVTCHYRTLSAYNNNSSYLKRILLLSYTHLSSQ